MSRCKVCHFDGLLFVLDLDDGGYVLCACDCPHGAVWRVKWQLRALVARLEPKPVAFGRIEEFFTDEEIAALHPREVTHQVQDGFELVNLVSREG